MKTKTEIMGELPNFYGTENYHRFSPLFRNFVLTDGAQYIADACGAYWLMDAIASHRAKYQGEGFAVVKLTVKDGQGKLKILDGNDKVLVRQSIDFTDFPLDEITLFCIQQDDLWVILLSSEY